MWNERKNIENRKIMCTFAVDFESKMVDASS